MTTAEALELIGEPGHATTTTPFDSLQNIERQPTVLRRATVSSAPKPNVPTNEEARS